MDSCKRGFLTQEELDQHIQNRHINPKPIKFICKICEKEDDAGKQAHIKANHIEKDGSIKCPKCDKICTSYGLGWFALVFMLWETIPNIFTRTFDNEVEQQDPP